MTNRVERCGVEQLQWPSRASVVRRYAETANYEKLFRDDSVNDHYC